jgi:glucose-fructose oxidoreductase
MIAACRRARVKLMVAHRPHFETMNLSATNLARCGDLGKLKFFNSSFAMTVRRGVIRTEQEYGGGTTSASTASVLRATYSAPNPRWCQQSL